MTVSHAFAAAYVKVEPQFLTPAQTSAYQKVNETLEIIFSRIKPYVRTEKYPKYYHDYTLISNDGTQNNAYLYVKNYGAELVYNSDTNELKYANTATENMYIANPFKDKKKSMSNLFSTHPPIEDRIEALRNIK